MTLNKLKRMGKAFTAVCRRLMGVLAHSKAVSRLSHAHKVDTSLTIRRLFIDVTSIESAKIAYYKPIQQFLTRILSKRKPSTVKSPPEANHTQHHNTWFMELVMLLKLPNMQLPNAVDHCQLGTMASETVVTID